MSKKNNNFLDDMADMFGYDYVIGHCLCSEYDVMNKSENETDEKKKKNLYRVANKYRVKAEQLTRERIANGL